jgi:microcystin-dependent protein
VNPAALDVSDPRGVFGFKDGAGRKPSLWLAPSGGLAYDSSDASQNQFSSALPNFFTSAGVWVHVAWVKQGEQYRFYRGGEQFFAAAAPPQFYANAATAYWLARADDCATDECRAKHFWKGQLAHARVYARALAAEEINRLMLDDQTANAAFKKAHPLEFSIYDDDQQPVLVVSDGLPERRLHVELANSSASTIELAQPSSPTPSRDNYHFELRFRPGTLSLPTLTRLGLVAAQGQSLPTQGQGLPAVGRGIADLASAQGDGWKVSRAQCPDGTVSIYFLNAAGATLRPGQSVALTLPHVAAEGSGGARGTRVELRYSQLSYAGETAQLSGSRARHLEIINERGKRNVPLHVGFLGSNRVLNDGQTPNDLWLRITNTLGDAGLPLTPTPSDAPSTFIISFDAQGDGEQREWALGTGGDLQNADLAVFRRPDPFEADGLELHLPLNTKGAIVPDESANENDGYVTGRPSLVPDDLLGRCLRFGGSDSIEVNDPFKYTDSFTISVWVNPDALDDGAYHGLLGHQNASDPRKPGLWLASKDGGLHYDSYDAAQNRYSEIIPNFFAKAGEWVHVAWVKQGEQYTFYRNGELFATKEAPAQFQRNAAEKYWVGKVDVFWTGRLAHARVYSRALSPDEIVKVMVADQQMIEDADWKGTKEVQGESPQWELTTTKAALSPGEIVQVKVWGVVSSLPSGEANLYVRYQNLPGYWDGQFVLSAEKSPVVYADQNVGIGTTRPRSALDTGLGVLTGAANAYQKAQFMMTGGGTVTWGPKDADSRRLMWTNRFIAISMERSPAIPAGHVNIVQPTSDIPAGQVWDGQPRSANQSGVVLKDWEALYAVHRVGGDENAVEFRIENYQRPDFTAPSNWLLVAVLNEEDKTVKLGTGQVVAAQSSTARGNPLPCGTIILWYGDPRGIPDGWVLCDGKNGTPNLTDRFVLGAGGHYQYNMSGGQESVTLKVEELPAHAHTAAVGDSGSHYHAIPCDKGTVGGGIFGGGGGLAQQQDDVRRGADAAFLGSTRNDGGHSHPVSVAAAGSNQPHDNMPPYMALCYIMKAF